MCVSNEKWLSKYLMTIANPKKKLLAKNWHSFKNISITSFGNNDRVETLLDYTTNAVSFVELFLCILTKSRVGDLCEKYLSYPHRFWMRLGNFLDFFLSRVVVAFPYKLVEPTD